MRGLKKALVVLLCAFLAYWVAVFGILLIDLALPSGSLSLGIRSTIYLIGIIVGVVIGIRRVRKWPSGDNEGPVNESDVLNTTATPASRNSGKSVLPPDA